MSCGIAVGEGNSAESPPKAKYPNGQNRNIIEFDETKQGRRFRAEISDDAIESIGQPLAYILGTRLTQQDRKSQPNNADEDTIEGQLVQIPSTSDIDEVTGQNNSTTNSPSPRALPVSGHSDLLNRLFRETSEKRLKLADSRLKQNSQSDFVARLSILFILAHEEKGRESIPRTDLNDLLEDSKVYNSTARGWIANTELLMIDSGFISLSVPGREQAHEFLREIRDDSIETKWKFDFRSKPRSTKRRTTEGSSESDGIKEGQKRKGESYTFLIRQLMDQGYFSTGRSTQEVNDELTRKGYKFELFRISESLIRLIKTTPLTRDKDASGHWKYKVDNEN